METKLCRYGREEVKGWEEFEGKKRGIKMYPVQVENLHVCLNPTNKFNLKWKLVNIAKMFIAKNVIFIILIFIV